jgi:hypothetical protein
MAILEKNPELKHGAREPYPIIATEAMGQLGRYLFRKYILK